MSAQQKYLDEHGIEEAIGAAIAEVLERRPSDPLKQIGALLIGRSRASASAASTISGYARCMNAKLRTSGRGEQNAEMMLVSRTQ